MANAPMLSLQKQAEATIREVFDYVIAQGDADYIGEDVSQLEHSLQAAQLAQDAGAERDIILGALLHDIGRFIPAAEKMSEMIDENGTYVGRASHEVVGEHYLRRLGFSEKICQVVGAHVMAKRYLTAVDKEYYDGLSKSSKTTLKFQGGIFDDAQVKEAQKDSLLEAKLAVRRWDDQAKVAGRKTSPLSRYETMAIDSLISSKSSVSLHGKTYRIPRRPTVVVCIDGFGPAYLKKGVKAGILPNLQKFMRIGFATTANSCMPSFTNPNNVSIITGMPPAVHGIAGNFFLDLETQKEHMIQDDTFLRGSTIFEQMEKAGVRVVAITAKDKLRKILGHGLKSSICFSAERAGCCTMGENHIEHVEEWLGSKAPPQYSGELSLFVLDAGIKLLQEDRGDLFYLTLSDYIQHKHAPGSKDSDAFLAALDMRLGQLADLGAIVAVTGDHGMNDKCGLDGKPDVLYLQDELEHQFGKNSVRVICPITDPFVRHHGALGSFVRVHFRQDLNLEEVVDCCKNYAQVEVALPKEIAAKEFELPLDREGHIVVVSRKHAVIGGRKEEHDLSNLGDHRLRSHGGRSEQAVPLIVSVPIEDKVDALSRSWRNFDIFDLVLNCVRVHSRLGWKS